jgi:16S rRNA (guanine(1405)-N(7))-methyltransferase
MQIQNDQLVSVPSSGSRKDIDSRQLPSGKLYTPNPNESSGNALEKLVEAVLTSSRYKHVSHDLIRSIGSRELAKRSNLKDAIKATKSKLHQVGGAYLTAKEDYAGWLNDLERLHHSGNQDAFLAYVKKVMSYHASTRERLPILNQFYHMILADLPPIHRVLDVACGFNPLALSWMPLAEPVEYYAYDIYKDMLVFLEKFMSLVQVQSQVQVCDIIQSCPTTQVDLAFVLKALPCLEQIDKSAGSELLHHINAKYIVVSFPVHSLGGRTKGMETNYEARFRSLVKSTTWLVKKFEFATELAFLIIKDE